MTALQFELVPFCLLQGPPRCLPLLPDDMMAKEVTLVFDLSKNKGKRDLNLWSLAQ